MQLCDGANAEERKRWFLRPAQEFHYLNQSSCYKLNRVDNADEFQVSHLQSIRWVKKAQNKVAPLRRCMLMNNICCYSVSHIFKDSCLRCLLVAENT